MYLSFSLLSLLKGHRFGPRRPHCHQKRLRSGKVPPLLRPLLWDRYRHVSLPRHDERPLLDPALYESGRCFNCGPQEKCEFAL